MLLWASRRGQGISGSHGRDVDSGNASRVQGAYEVQGRSTTPAQWEILRLGADRQGLGRGGEENRRPLTCRGSKSLREGYAKLPVGAHETKGSIRNKQQRQGIGAARTAWQHTLAQQQRISHRGFSMQVGETSEAARRPDHMEESRLGTNGRTGNPPRLDLINYQHGPDPRLIHKVPAQPG